MGSRVEIFHVETLAKLSEVIFAPKGFRPEQLTPVDILFNPSANEAMLRSGVQIMWRSSTSIARKSRNILVGRRLGLGLSPDGKLLAVLNGLSDDFTFIDLDTKRPLLTKRAGLVPHSIEVFK